MCGIIALRRYSTPVDRFMHAVSLISHRGPDYCAAVQVNNEVLLGHTRLSILDLNERANQPMCFNGIYLIYNGEIYNFRELRHVLESRGIDLKTTSDTEVVLKLYSCLGPQFASMLNGIFAFVIYDSKKDLLLYGRDRYGIKPLYERSDQGQFTLCSEIKPILYLDPNYQLNRQAVSSMLGTNYVFGRETLFDSIRSVEPGKLFCKEGAGSVRVLQTYGIEDSEDTELQANTKELSRGGLSEDELLNRFEELLQTSIVGQMVADVPIGIFLSAGLDSGVLAYFVSKHATYKVNSYSFSNLGYPDDEAQIAKEYAKQLGFNHENIVIDLVNDFQTLYHNALYHYEFPIAYPSAIPLFALAKEAGKHNKVVMTGDGGDELLAGYTKYATMSELANNPRFRLKSSLNKLLYGNKRTNEQLFQQLSTYFPNYRTFLNIDRRQSDFSQSSHQEVDLINGALLFDQQNYLQGMLHKTDTMTMAHSLEARVPYLDNHFSAFCNKLPSQLKLSGTTTKYILRKVASKYLPNDYLAMQKKGFPTRFIQQMVSNQAMEIIERFVNHITIKDNINKSELNDFVTGVSCGKIDYVTIWIMKSYVDWYKVFFEDRPFLKNRLECEVKLGANIV